MKACTYDISCWHYTPSVRYIKYSLNANTQNNGCYISLTQWLINVRAGTVEGTSSGKGKEIFYSTRAPRTTLKPTQPPVPWGPEPVAGCKVDGTWDSPPTTFSSEVQTGYSYTSTLR